MSVRLVRNRQAFQLHDPQRVGGGAGILLALGVETIWVAIGLCGLDSYPCGRVSVFDAKLVKDPLKMFLYGAAADAKNRADFRIRLALCNPAENFRFAKTQSKLGKGRVR